MIAIEGTLRLTCAPFVQMNTPSAAAEGASAPVVIKVRASRLSLVQELGLALVILFLGGILSIYGWHDAAPGRANSFLNFDNLIDGVATPMSYYAIMANQITANSPENVATYRWIGSYPKRFGARGLLGFRDGFRNFASPQNPFFTGRVAMVLQGPWIYTFIKNFGPPDFEWGVAPFPSADPEKLKDVTLVETDALVIPAGAKHPEEAFAFIKYVNTQGPMEKLCIAQRKFSPLRETSPDFFRLHPNPYIDKFLALSKSPNAHYIPQLTMWTVYSNDMQQAFGRIWDGNSNASVALNEVERHAQQVFEQRQERWHHLADKLQAEWKSKP